MADEFAGPHDVRRGRGTWPRAPAGTRSAARPLDRGPARRRSPPPAPSSRPDGAAATHLVGAQRLPEPVPQPRCNADSSRVANWSRGRGRSVGSDVVIVPGVPGEHQHPVAQVDRLVQVVGDEHDRRAGLAACTPSSTSCSAALVMASSAPNGSSISSTRASSASARAICTRWAMPPDSRPDSRRPGRQADHPQRVRRPAGAAPRGRSGAPARARCCARRSATAAARCGSPGTPSPRLAGGPASAPSKMTELRP